MSGEPKRVYGCDPAGGPDGYATLMEAEVGDDGVLTVTSVVVLQLKADGD